jgi:hypothetical protein
VQPGLGLINLLSPKAAEIRNIPSIPTSQRPKKRQGLLSSLLAFDRKTEFFIGSDKIKEVIAISQPSPRILGRMDGPSLRPCDYMGNGGLKRKSTALE